MTPPRRIVLKCDDDDNVISVFTACGDQRPDVAYNSGYGEVVDYFALKDRAELIKKAGGIYDSFDVNKGLHPVDVAQKARECAEEVSRFLGLPVDPPSVPLSVSLQREQAQWKSCVADYSAAVAEVNRLEDELRRAEEAREVASEKLSSEAVRIAEAINLASAAPDMTVAEKRLLSNIFSALWDIGTWGGGPDDDEKSLKSYANLLKNTSGR